MEATRVEASCRRLLGQCTEFTTCNSGDDFVNNEPAVLRRWVSEPDVLNEWTHEHLRQKHGDLLVPLAVGPRLQSQWQRIRLSEAIDSFKTVNGLQRYIRQMPPPLELLTAIEPLRIKHLAPQDRLVILNLWIGPAGTVQPFHKDNHNPKAVLHGLLVQLFGRKEILAVSSSHDQCMYQLSPGPHGHYSAVDIDAIDSHFPMFRKARVRRVLLSPGDVAYWPPDTWHRVESREPSVSLSCWWHRDKVADRIYRAARHTALPADASTLSLDDLEEFGKPGELLEAIRTLGVSSVVLFLRSCDSRARAFLLAQAELVPS